jgi:hypothetical protein
MKRPEVNEALTVLYLRLAGYFTTGLVVHSSDWGRNRTEIDCVAVRLPHHRQPEREVMPPGFLGLHDGQTDLLVCEVKSLAKDLKFNERLATEADTLAAVLRWAGAIEEQTIGNVVGQLQPLMHTNVTANAAREGVVEKGIRVRGLLACPPCEPKDAPNTWFLPGSEILRFAHECFNPPIPRSECSTRYNFHLWGSWLSPIVDYLKGCSADKPPTLDGLYNHLKC